MRASSSLPITCSRPAASESNDDGCAARRCIAAAGVVSAFMLWIMFVNLAGRENSRWFGGRPGTLGVRDGK